MPKEIKKILVTGGAGFIGSNFLRYFIERHPRCKVVNLDKLTYAGNLNNIKAFKKNPNYKFIKGDICDVQLVTKAMAGCDAVVNFAAESHVDKSIIACDDFILTNVYGLNQLLKVALKCNLEKFVHISTDEVYGSINKGSFTEGSPINPSSPYSASKAAADALALSYFKTYRLPVVITRSSNNFSPYQYPEKVIPLFTTNALEGKELPLYGRGSNVRDWIYVEDNCRAIDLVMHRGGLGEIYNIGGNFEITNKELAVLILSLMGKPKSLIKHIDDRPAHDYRYALNCDKLRKLGWRCKTDFQTALTTTIAWYRKNLSWWQDLKRKKGFKSYYDSQYGEK